MVSGTTRPPFFGNWLNTVSYKGFSLSANISVKLGYVFRKTSVDYNALFNSWVGNVDFTRRWLHPGDEQHTSVPSMVYPADYNRDQFYTLSEATVEKGGVVRVQDIRFSYQYRQWRLFAYASNVGILWRANKDGIDPDYGRVCQRRSAWPSGSKLIFNDKNDCYAQNYGLALMPAGIGRLPQIPGRENRQDTGPARDTG